MKQFCRLFNCTQGGLLARIAAITGSDVDYLVETTGVPEMEALAVEALSWNGTAVFVATASGRVALPEDGRRSASSRGTPCRNVSTQVDRAVSGGKFPFDRLIRFYDFKDINGAMDDARSGRTIKPVLRIETL